MTLRSASPGGTVDYKAAFTHVFEDPRWPAKLGLGALILLLGLVLIVPLFVVAGYFIRAVRWEREGRSGLPGWDGLGALLVTGARYSLAVLLYALPVLAVFVAPFFVVAALPERIDNVAVALLFFVSYFFFAMVAGLASIVIFPAVTIWFAYRDSVPACLEVREIFSSLRAHASHFFSVLMVLYAVSYAAALGVLALVVGLLFTTFYALLVAAHLEGQLIRLMAGPVSPHEQALGENAASPASA